GSVTGRYRQLMRLFAFLCLTSSIVAIYCSCPLWVMASLAFLVGFSSGGYLLAFTVVKQVSGTGHEGIALASINTFTLLGGPFMQPLVGQILQKNCEASDGVVAIAHYRSALFPIIIVQIIALLATFFFSNIDMKMPCQHSRLSRKS
ncbi:hypothetical protein N9V90_01350, partial [Endozoicomonas sp.]|nr:hypothetical protein [Endozoicomonas sp.]